MTTLIRLALLTLGLAVLLTACLCGGCSQTIYDRTTTTIDPSGLVTIENVHIGATSLATAKAIESLMIRTDRGAFSLNGATVDNDSVKAITPYVIIETKGK